MKVILTEDIKSLGLKGDIKEVSDGYANNFLLAQDKAVLASPANIASFQAQQNKADAKVSAQEENYQKIAKTLNKQSISFTGKVSDKNTLFKGISTNDIIAEVKNKFNLEIHDNWFVKPSLLKELGKHNVFLRLPSNQLISFFINIKSE
ncbi:MAG: 50S ribosomal protein L9 [Candidatus Komeilibacteria bacterium]|jgi:large subunit ribosomal protein L9|nr:50S ribosomal protein L9 [Candidatus Komeilibacteria bacterium]MBT4447771.1 50S ribosomal protein L9 [Candidatus Komeilibacteria bacterium]